MWHRRGSLTADGEPVPLSRRAFEILELLLERRGEIVTKDEIFSRVWRGLFVDESNLPVHISALRKAFGPDRDMVKTIPGRGYLFADDTVASEPVPTDSAEAALPITATNLPRPAGPLFGRAAVLAELEARMRETRLLSVVGMGGIGKTRLAIELGWQLARLFPDGVWLVDLAPLGADAAVATAVATVLGIAVPDPDKAAATVAAAIGRQRMLLIFDNCEHLTASVAPLIEALLQAAPLLAVIAGSQAKLRVEGEFVYPLSPLDLPPPEAERIDGFGAIELFAARAHASDRRFRLDAGNAASVGAICRGLEGIPLALEMAAARVPLLGLEGLRAGLDERLRMLKFGTADTETRHRTLRAMVDWSHSLLDETEQRLFRRLAIFAGGFTLDSAAAVAGETADRWETVDVLSQLIDKSLVVADGGDPPRYRLLETLRLHGLEQLDLHGETAALAECHALHFAGLMTEADQVWRKMQSETWLRIYRPEIDNARIALKWAFDRPERSGTAIRLVGSAARLWHTLNLIGEGKQHLGRADALIDETTPRLHVARLWLEYASIWRNSDRPRALALTEKSVALYRVLDDRHGLTTILTLQGTILCFLGRLDEAKSVLLEAQALAFPGDLSQSQIAVTSHLALLANMMNQPIEARRWYSEALGLARAFKEDLRAIHMLQGLGEVEFVLGEIDSAVERARQVVTTCRSIKYKALILDVALINFSAYLLAQGNLAEARPAAREAFELVTDEGGYILTVAQEQWALIGAMEGRHRDAAELSGYIDARYAETGDARQPTEQLLYDRLRHILAANLTADELENCAAEGRQWTEDQARRVTIDRLIAPRG